MPPSPEGVMDWRGRLETRAAWWTLLAGVPVFVLSAFAVPMLAGLAVIWGARQDWLFALWALAAALIGLYAILISVEALGQLWWRRLGHALALWAVAAASWPDWWIS